MRLMTSLYLLMCAGAVMAEDSPIVQPGAPGTPSRELTAEQAIEVANSSYSPNDAQFMQDMIPHHNQAVQMAELVAERTNRQELVDIAGRINVSQADEIAFMQQWLQSRGEKVPDPTAHAAMHTTSNRYPAVQTSRWVVKSMNGSKASGYASRPRRLAALLTA